MLDPNSRNPGLVIFIIDQSARMSEPITECFSKTTLATKWVNQMIYELILINSAGDQVIDRLFISLIGYSNESVEYLKSGYLSEFDNNPIRVDNYKKKVSDGAGGVVEIECQFPVFVQEKSEGYSCSGLAFESAYELAKEWNKKDAKQPAPIIFHLTGGYTADWKKMITFSNKIKGLPYNEKTTIINCLLSFESDVVYPSLEEIFKKSFVEQLLFEVSTYITNAQCSRGLRCGIQLNVLSKNLISNSLPNIGLYIDFGS